MVAYRTLNFAADWKNTTTLPSVLVYVGMPYHVFDPRVVCFLTSWCRVSANSLSVPVISAIAARHAASRSALSLAAFASAAAARIAAFSSLLKGDEVALGLHGDITTRVVSMALSCDQRKRAQMVSVGEESYNQKSGERFVWRATRDSTKGEYLEFDLYLAEGSKVAAAHRHPSQTETFNVVSGDLKLKSGKVTSNLKAGDGAVIPPNTPHNWGNASPTPSHVIVRLTPSLNSEDFFAAFCSIAKAGKAANSGLPRNPLQLGVLMTAYRAEFVVAAKWQQALAGPVLALFAAIGRRAGFTSAPNYRGPKAAEDAGAA